MQHLNSEHTTPNRVVAVLLASAVSTLEDLAERLPYLHDRHDGTLISVAVRLHA